MRPSPVYTVENCKFAYQLCWSLTLFWKVQPPANGWLVDLKLATETDGVRILRHRFGERDCSMFLVSTRPETPPSRISWSVKGRLQHLHRSRSPHAFQRNYDLRSVGSTEGPKVEAYVASQLQHHSLLTDRLDNLFRDLQIVQPEVDLMEPRFAAHCRFSCNLHVVLVHDRRECETHFDIWVSVRQMIRTASAAKGHLLSRVGILPDHLHLVIGTHPDESPAEVALSYMNNICFVHGMRPVFMYGCFVAGFGEYNLGAIHDQ